MRPRRAANASKRTLQGPMRGSFSGRYSFADAPIAAKGKIALSVEGRQALEKYLELAPDGPHASDVKAMLEMAVK